MLEERTCPSEEPIKPWQIMMVSSIFVAALAVLSFFIIFYVSLQSRQMQLLGSIGNGTNGLTSGGGAIGSRVAAFQATVNNNANLLTVKVESIAKSVESTIESAVFSVGLTAASKTLSLGTSLASSAASGIATIATGMADIASRISSFALKTLSRMGQSLASLVASFHP